MLRAVNVVAVWSLTSTAAARLGVVETAAHQLVLGLFVFLNNAMTSFSTIGTVAAARRLETEGAPGVRAGGRDWPAARHEDEAQGREQGREGRPVHRKQLEPSRSG